MQQYAESAVKSHIALFRMTFLNIGKAIQMRPFPEDFDKDQINEILEQGMKRSDRYKRLKQMGVSEKNIYSDFRTKTKMRVFTWKGEKDTVMTPLDSVKYYKYFIHSGVMSMDPNTGHVKAYVGGIDYKYFKYDHVKIGRRQVGSTFKPFLYALAMQEGYSPCYEIPNVPVVFEKINGIT